MKIKKSLGILSSIFLFVFSSNSNAIVADLAQITLRPYLAVGYSLSGTQNAQYGGISYESMLPYIFNSFGGSIGLRGRYFMGEFGVYGAFPSQSGTNNGGGYGVTGTTMDMITMRFSGIFTLHSDIFGDDNNLLIILGIVHAFSNINYQVSNPAALPVGLQYGGFGTNIEVGIGYMRDITDNFAIRTDFRYSPIVISGMTNGLFTWNIAFLGIL